MVRYLVDEDLDNRILRDARRVVPQVDLLRVQDAGLSSHIDDEVLRHAAEVERIVVTHDVSTMTAAAYRRIERAEPMAGAIIIPQEMPIGRAINDLTLIAAASEPHEWKDQVVFLPL